MRSAGARSSCRATPDPMAASGGRPSDGRSEMSAKDLVGRVRESRPGRSRSSWRSSGARSRPARGDRHHRAPTTASAGLGRRPRDDAGGDHSRVRHVPGRHSPPPPSPATCRYRIRSSAACRFQSPPPRPSRTTVPTVPLTPLRPAASARITLPEGVLSAFGSIWVTGHHSRTAFRLDPSTGAVLARIPGIGPYAQWPFAGGGLVLGSLGQLAHRDRSRSEQRRPDVPGAGRLRRVRVGPPWVRRRERLPGGARPEDRGAAARG